MKQEDAVADLWRNFLSTGKTEFRDELIVHYLFLVKYVVGRLGSTLPTHIKLDDLYSSGVTGLMRAVEKYDNQRAAKFESYAILLIKGAIIDELRELDWIPRSIHQKANEVSNAQSDLQQELGRAPTDEELSEHLGMSEEEFEDLLLRIRPAVLLPLNAEISTGGEDSTTLSERIADQRAETGFDVAHKSEFCAILKEAIQNLPDQEREVLTLYYYEEMMLKEIGKVMGVSESRVSQIHTKALLKLRHRLQRQLDYEMSIE
ncbi:MAG: FliA/WhiG family RNA polymerase sigma factor [Chlamydiales bacterium]|nr:FliA/WhiG family RNA polymerase sigma factor [Chlamydiales bacterium]